MNKELVLQKLEELGFAAEEAGDFGYVFTFEELNILYMLDDDDDDFLRFAVPGIYDITEENLPLVLEVVNDTNKSIKYSKTCVYGDDVWVFYEYHTIGNEHLEEILEHILRVLQITYFLFHRKIEGDNTLPGADNDENEDKTKEDEE